MVTDAGIEYTPDLRRLDGTGLQAHIHFGAVGQAGGISVFLCTNLGNGPAGTQACPAAPVRSRAPSSRPTSIGPGGQGIAATEYEELIAAIRSRHGVRQRAQLDLRRGEIRGQIEGGHEGHH